MELISHPKVLFNREGMYGLNLGFSGVSIDFMRNQASNLIHILRYEEKSIIDSIFGSNSREGFDYFSFLNSRQFDKNTLLEKYRREVNWRDNSKIETIWDENGFYVAYSNEFSETFKKFFIAFQKYFWDDQKVFHIGTENFLGGPGLVLAREEDIFEVLDPPRLEGLFNPTHNK